MGFRQTKDLDYYEVVKKKVRFHRTKDLKNCIKGKGKKIMGFEQTKDFDCYEEGRKKMGVDPTKYLELYEYTQEKAEKSWVSSELKI